MMSVIVADEKSFTFNKKKATKFCDLHESLLGQNSY